MGRDVYSVYLQRQNGVGVKQLLELVAYYFEQHYATNALETAASTARTGSYEHAHGQYHPCYMWPTGGIVAEKSCGGDERYHLEYGHAKGFFQLVVVAYD